MQKGLINGHLCTLHVIQVIWKSYKSYWSSPRSTLKRCLPWIELLFTRRASKGTAKLSRRSLNLEPIQTAEILTSALLFIVLQSMANSQPWIFFCKNQRPTHNSETNTATSPATSPKISKQEKHWQAQPYSLQVWCLRTKATIYKAQWSTLNMAEQPLEVS